MRSSLPADAAERFARDGYYVIEDALDEAQLATLRSESELAIAAQEEDIKNQRDTVEALNRLGRRYFVPRRSVFRPGLRELVLGQPTAQLLGPLLGPKAYLFIDVFVYKAAESESDFAWHQDHGYLAHFGFGRFAPNVTVWAPLVDAHADNGTLHVLPFSRGGASKPVQHVLDPNTDDCVAHVDEPGDCIELRAGGLLIMSGVLLHRSGPNRTSRPRPAYQWQYSPAPVVDGDQPISLASPFLEDGKWVGRTAD